MGRKPSRWQNLPKGMRARERGKKTHYYLDTGGTPRKEIPLGSDYVAAVRKWSELAMAQRPASGEYTFLHVMEAYRTKVLPTKAPRTQQDNETELSWLTKFFGDPPAPLDKIEPIHIRQYLDWRVQQAKNDAQQRNVQRIKDGRKPLAIPANIGHTRANRDKALFSHMWNFARNEGYTKNPNPCAGIKGFKESGRDVVISDDLMTKIMQHASQPLQFAIKLAHLTGQRPGDVLRMSEGHIVGDLLNVRQGKTGAKLRIEISGELRTLLDEISAYKSGFKVRALSLLVNESGQQLTAAMLRKRFDAAREAAGIKKADFQFRDLRATAATQIDESAGIRSAQSLLGHTTEGMTANYIRHKVGKKVGPVR